MTTESLTSETVTNRGICPDCGRRVGLYRDLDGFGRPQEDRPYRINFHAGNKWGRPCRGSNEQYTGDEP
jgi:hypothetical protein